MHTICLTYFDLAVLSLLYFCVEYFVGPTDGQISVAYVLSLLFHTTLLSLACLGAFDYFSHKNKTGSLDIIATFCTFDQSLTETGSQIALVWIYTAIHRSPMVNGKQSMRCFVEPGEGYVQDHLQFIIYTQTV